MNHCLIFSCHTIWHRRPGGAYRIASYLREHDWDAEVLEWAPYFTQEELREFARSRITNKTIFLGFSCFFGHWDPNLEEFAQWVKDTYPHVKIVLGMSNKPRMVSPATDYFVYGFGEHAIIALAQSFTGNTPSGGIKLDPMFLARGKKVIPANDFYPAFPMKSLMIKYEDRDYIQPTDWLTVEFARGCMFECLYCNFPVLGVKGDYTRDADDYVRQLQDAYDRFGVTNYYVSDETFNDRHEKVIKFADATEQLSFRPFMSGFIRADLMVSREQDWEPLSRLGLVGHFYGVETFNHASAKKIGKGMHPDKLKEGLLKARQYFKTHDRKLYRGLIALMVGLPHETKESISDAANWLRENWRGEAVDFTPLEIPIDEYTDKLSKLGKDWRKWGYQDADQEINNINREWVMVNHSINNLNWKNEHMDLNWARDFAVDFYNKENPTRSWGLHNFLLDSGTAFGINDLSKLLEMPQVDIVPSQDKIFFKNLLVYKSKKLNASVEQLTQDFPKFEPWKTPEKQVALANNSDSHNANTNQ